MTTFGMYIKFHSFLKADFLLGSAIKPSPPVAGFFLAAGYDEPAEEVEAAAGE